MFKDILKDAVHRTEGGMAALVMGFDGIAVDSYVREDSTLGVEVETVGMEYSVILKEIRKAAQLLDAGTVRRLAGDGHRLAPRDDLGWGQLAHPPQVGVARSQQGVGLALVFQAQGGSGGSSPLGGGLAGSTFCQIGS